MPEAPPPNNVDPITAQLLYDRQLELEAVVRDALQLHANVIRQLADHVGFEPDTTRGDTDADEG